MTTGSKYPNKSAAEQVKHCPPLTAELTVRTDKIRYLLNTLKDISMSKKKPTIPMNWGDAKNLLYL